MKCQEAWSSNLIFLSKCMMSDLQDDANSLSFKEQSSQSRLTASLEARTVSLRLTFATLTTRRRVGEGKYFVIRSAKNKLKRESEIDFPLELHISPFFL